MLSIIIPAKNEESRLPGCLGKTIDYISGQEYESEIIVVCDGCTDSTAETAYSFKDKYKNLKVLEYSPNRGKGYAVKRGVLEAAGDMVLFMDADYAVPIETIAPFINSLKNGFDVVIGSRGHEETQVTRHQWFLRELAGKCFGRLQKIVLRIPFYDTQCGFKLFTREAADYLFPKLQYECSYFDAELIYTAYYSGMKIKELPVEWNHDGMTRMPIGPGRMIDLLKKLFGMKKIHKDISQDNWKNLLP
jgi:dolichyl-phosphate beta-glucosyltransferase